MLLLLFPLTFDFLDVLIHVFLLFLLVKSPSRRLHREEYFHLLSSKEHTYFFFVVLEQHQKPKYQQIQELAPHPHTNLMHAVLLAHLCHVQDLTSSPLTRRRVKYDVKCMEQHDSLYIYHITFYHPWLPWHRQFPLLLAALLACWPQIFPLLLVRVVLLRPPFFFCVFNK